MSAPVLSFVLLVCLFASLKANTVPVTCVDLCNRTSTERTCATYTGTFLQVNSPNYVWFSAQLTNAGSLLSASGQTSIGLTFTQQSITVGGQTFTPPDVALTINSASTSTTSQSGGLITTVGGAPCGNIFLSGLSVPVSTPISEGVSWTWCGLFSTSNNTQLGGVNPTWSFGAAAYDTRFSTNFNSLGVRASSGCLPAVGVSSAGQPELKIPNRMVGGTALPEGTDPVGQRQGATSVPCICTATFAPTFAPTTAPTGRPTNAPTARPTNAPTTSPTGAPTNEPTARPTNAPTPPTNEPTSRPTNAPTTRPTGAPTNEPTARPTNAPTPPTNAPTSRPTNEPTARPTNAPTPPTQAPTSRPTNAPTTRPTNRPTTEPTGRPTNAPTPPTNAPTSRPTNEPTTRPTNAPTAPTEAPTARPTNEPTTRPTGAPTNEPTARPTNAPTPPTNEPTARPTNEPTTRPTGAPSNAPTGRPTSEPTNAPTRAPTPPTQSPTNSPTPPTKYPTRAPTPPTIPPPTLAPTTGAPTAPIDICTRKWSAHFVLTYNQMTHGYVEGTVVYDWTKGVLAFYYSNQTYQEIYQFNSQLGIGSVNGQQVYRISPNGTCAPCSRYQNNWAFPILWNTSSAQFLPGATDANGCTNYTAPAGTNYWDTYFGLRQDGSVCYLSNQGRLFTLDNIVYCAPYNPSLITPPIGCVCNTPQDIVFSLDRSSSILTSSTYIYREFLTQFVNSYTFNPASPSTSTQMGIVQWGNVLNPTASPYPIGNYGSIPFTMDPNNIQATVSQIGCVGNPCNFCDGNNNASYCIYPTVYKTCTSCGLYGAGQLFLDTANYKKRALSSQVIIVITDGNANTLNSSYSATGSQLCCGDGNPITSALVPGVDDDCIDGEWQTHAPLGCFTDINATRAQVQAQVPGVSIFALGVGPYVNLPTLEVIASNPQSVFAATDWTTFLSKLQDIITLTCVEPDPIKSCGTLACGFCACGNSQTPDGIVPPNLCDQIKIVKQGTCYAGVPIPLGCPVLPCLTAGCDPALNNSQGGCIYTDRICNQTNPCWKPYCIRGACVPRVICDDTKPGCGCVTRAPVAPSAPTSAPTVATQCINTTGNPVALGCGDQGSCDTPTGNCLCVGGFHGILCQFPPGVDECATVGDCQDSNICTIDSCVNKSCTYRPLNCNDNNKCTTDFCNATGCQHLLTVICDDNDGCTDDYCKPADGKCYHTNRSSNCNNLTNICNTGYCDPKAPVNNQCFQKPFVCPRDNNCTVAICSLNSTKPNKPGCSNTTLDCVHNYGALAGGIAAGVLAGIIVAALLAAAGCAGGGAYAANNALSESTETQTVCNPLYEGDDKQGDNPLFQHGHHG